MTSALEYKHKRTGEAMVYTGAGMGISAVFAHFRSLHPDWPGMDLADFTVTSLPQDESKPMTNTPTIHASDCQPGDLVTICVHPEADKTKISSYRDGMYFVLNVIGDKSLRVSKYASGYEGKDTHTFIIDEDHYVIVDHDEDYVALSDHIDDLIEFSKIPQSGGHKQWIDSVYETARTTARQLSRILDRIAEEVVEEDEEANMSITDGRVQVTGTLCPKSGSFWPNGSNWPVALKPIPYVFGIDPATGADSMVITEIEFNGSVYRLVV